MPTPTLAEVRRPTTLTVLAVIVLPLMVEYPSEVVWILEADSVLINIVLVMMDEP